MSFHSRTLLYPQAETPRTPPVNLDTTHEHFFKHEYSCAFHETYTYIYTHAVVTGRGLAAHKNRVVWDMIPQSIHTEHPTRYLKMKTHALRLYSRYSNSFQNALYFTDDNAHGYFHWITECLPKLLSTPHLIDSKYIILIPEKFYSPIVKNSLSILGVNPTQLYIIPNNKKVYVENLLAIGSLTLPAKSGNYRPTSMIQTRTHITSHNIIDDYTKQYLLSRYGTKIYISRADANYRYITNEQEITPLLTKYGYTILHASDLTFSEQVYLFSHATTIIGLHGAGLTNMMWMTSPRARIVEIRHPHDSHNNCYFSLASALGIQYWYSLAHTHDSHTHTANFIWNINDARLLMEALHG